MIRVWPRIRRLPGLGRPELLAAQISVAWLMVFLAFGIEPVIRRNPALESLGLWWSLLASAVVAKGLGVFMLALNDVVDARHDRAFAPDRPIPSGDVSQRAALGLAMTGLLAALAASVAFGTLSVLLTLGAVGAIVFYNLAGRFIPSVGIISLGLIVGVCALIPNPNLALAWPILLMMTHVIVSATMRYVLGGKRPRLTAVHFGAVLMGWVFWCLVVLVLMRVRSHEITHEGVGLVWLGPSVAAVGLLLLTWLMLGPSTMQPRARRGTAARFTKLATGWLIVFNASWLFSAGLWWQGLVVLGLIVVAVWLADEG